MKSFRAYVALDPAQRGRFTNETLMRDVLPNILSVDPGPHTWSTLGVVPPTPRGNTLHHHTTNNTVLLHFRRCERILPSSVINDLVDKTVGQMLEEEGDGRKIATKKERAQIKHDVVAEQLPKTVFKSTTVPVYIRNEYILIGATSARLCEAILGKLRAALGSLKVVPLDTLNPPATLLRTLALSGDKHQDGQSPLALRAGLAGVLVDTEDCKTTFSNTPVDSEHIVDALAEDYAVHELQILAYADEKDTQPTATVKVNKALAFKGFKLATGLLEDATQEAGELDDAGEEHLAAMSHFDATTILVAETAFDLVASIAALSGGRRVGEQETTLIEEFMGGRASLFETPTAETLPDDYYDDL